MTRREAVAWTLALLASAALLAARGYRPRDPDSLLYARMAADLAERPAERWIAPLWPPGEYMQGLYREHPAGLFAPAALLARAGYPRLQAAYAVNALYQVLALALAVRVASALVPGLEARALLWVLQLLPVAFTYRARANQEQPVLLFLLLALWGIEGSRRSARFMLATVMGLAGLLLVKGVLALPAIACCAAWAWLLPSEGGGRRVWTGFGLALAACAAATLGYEQLYRAATGESFLADYLGRQVGSGLKSPFERLETSAYNLVWYGARVLWFAFPWSLPALLALPRAARALADAIRRRAPASAGAVGAAFALAVTLVYLGLLCFADRRAERYIFPVYFVVGAAGAIAALRLSGRLRRLAARLEGSWAGPALFVVLLLLHLAGGAIGLPRIKVWAPDV